MYKVNNNYIKLLRMRRNMSQKELAQILKVHPRTICGAESGQRPPSLEIISKYSVFFGIKNIAKFFIWVGKDGFGDPKMDEETEE